MSQGRVKGIIHRHCSFCCTLKQIEKFVITKRFLNSSVPKRVEMFTAAASTRISTSYLFPVNSTAFSIAIGRLAADIVMLFTSSPWINLRACFGLNGDADVFDH